MKAVYVGPNAEAFSDGITAHAFQSPAVMNLTRDRSHQS